MVTLKFSAEKLEKQVIFIPTVCADYHKKKENACVELFFCWLYREYIVDIAWTRKTNKVTRVYGDEEE